MVLKKKTIMPILKIKYLLFIFKIFFLLFLSNFSVHQVSLFHEDDSEHTALPLLADDNGRFCIFSLRFSANGDEILGGANNGYIYVYDRFAQTRSLRIDAHDDDVNAVAFVDTATHILASGGKNNLKSEDYVHGVLDFF